MDKKLKYQALIKEAIRKYAYPDEGNYDEFETQIVFDDERGHYFLMDVGWNEMKRIHGFTLHIDLKGEKIWIQQDWTEAGVTDIFLEAGVPNEDIVLAFHAPYKHPFTDFATA